MDNVAATSFGDIRALPKAQSHLHLTGAMRPGTLRELATRYGVPVPPAWDHTRVQEWAAFQGRYDAAREVIRTPTDVARVISEAAEDDAADGCGWMEIQVDPTSYAPAFGGMEAVVEAVLSAAAASPVPTGVIIASSWARSGDHAEALARLAVRYAGSGVVGFGLSNDERLGDVVDYVPAFRLAADAGLLLTPHSGFYTGAGHVRDCVDLLKATRIGHGTAAVTEPSVLALLAERQVAMEICPTSYAPLGVHEPSDVPVRTVLDAGIPVTIGSDDPLVFGAGLAEQYALCRDVLGLDDALLAVLARHSIASSAAPDEIKRVLTAGVDAWFR
ncbi:adenosine deaminase [Phytoactinopolyspora halotolerans]|uniref:Adenosine deaminase n=1 Tax=Phytoactinopolyspora halotolerans TaxID=1981512 RepID=A0A6L9S2V1_9ACTN|nr:adenosine deaminase [Phytoactinopolyspora halotolerans]NED99378.1 adenosine deaminase [Phytoactinopolyspora halotolerans]